MADYRLRCVKCGKDFLAYRGAAETKTGRTCLSCWFEETGADSPLREDSYGGGHPEAREVFPAADEPRNCPSLASALFRTRRRNDQR
jgi:hypothetical protein